jgi:hypothetical protein
MEIITTNSLIMEAVFNHLSVKDAINVMKAYLMEDTKLLKYCGKYCDEEESLYVVHHGHPSRDTTNFYEWCSVHNITKIDDDAVEQFLQLEEKEENKFFDKRPVFEMYLKTELHSLATILGLSMPKSCNKGELVDDILQYLIDIEQYVHIEVDPEGLIELKELIRGDEIKFKKGFFKKIQQCDLLDFFTLASTINRFLNIDNMTWFKQKAFHKKSLEPSVDIFNLVSITIF